MDNKTVVSEFLLQNPNWDEFSLRELYQLNLRIGINYYRVPIDRKFLIQLIVQNFNIDNIQDSLSEWMTKMQDKKSFKSNWEYYSRNDVCEFFSLDMWKNVSLIRLAQLADIFEFKGVDNKDRELRLIELLTEFFRFKFINDVIIYANSFYNISLDIEKFLSVFIPVFRFSQKFYIDNNYYDDHNWKIIDEYKVRTILDELELDRSQYKDRVKQIYLTHKKDVSGVIEYIKIFPFEK